MTTDFFVIKLSIVSKNLREIGLVISTQVGPDFVKFTKNVANLVLAATEFQVKFGFLQSIGCIDPMHIPLNQPNEISHNYYCYKIKYLYDVSQDIVHGAVALKKQNQCFHHRTIKDSSIPLSYYQALKFVVLFRSILENICNITLKRK